MTGGRAERLAPDVLLLTGDAIELAAAAIAMAIQYRALEGRPPHRGLQSLLAECRPRPQGDKLDEAAGHPETARMVPSAEAAEVLGLSPRQARRLAPKLGGQLVAGRWLVDRDALLEHRQGLHNSTKDEPE